MSRITFQVYGDPGPQGSKTRSRYGAVYESSKKVLPWREAVKAAALDAAPRHGWVQIQRGTPVRLTVTFQHARPAAHYGTGRNAGALKPSAPKYKATAPDLSKLIRATEDALTDVGIWADDAIVASIDARDVYHGHSGAEITIETLED